MNNTKHLIPISFIICLLAGYLLPWIIAPTAPLTLNAYDLAEWTSLHPSQPHTTPALIVSLYLRVQLLLIGLLIAINVRKRWITVAGIMIIAIAQFPPLEFILSETSNINYQQQFYLSVGSVLIGIGFSSFSVTRWRSLWNLAIALVGIITSTLGVTQTSELLVMSLQQHSIGWGFFVVAMSYASLGLLEAIHIRGLFTKP